MNENGGTAGYYYRYFDYEDVSRSLQTKKTYRRNVMAVTKESFQKAVSHIGAIDTNLNAVYHLVWIVPSQFCKIRCTENARHLSRDDAPEL